MRYTPARAQQRKRFVQVTEFPRPRIRVNQIELTRRRLFEELCTIHDVKAHTTVGTKMALRNCYHCRIGIDRIKRRCSIPCRQGATLSVSGSSSKLEKPPARLRSRENREQRPHLGL